MKPITPGSVPRFPRQRTLLGHQQLLSVSPRKMLPHVAFLLVLLQITSAQRSVRPGNTCRVQDGRSGTCKRIDACPSAIQDLRANKQPIICSYDKFTPVVCCPQEDNMRVSTAPPSPNAGLKSKQKCNEYAKLAWKLVPDPVLSYDSGYINKSTCGMSSEPLIIGGKLASEREFPHMALIGYGEKSENAWYCGGSLISNRYILTAGHCLRSRDKGNARWVRLGEVVLDSDMDNTITQDYSIIKAIPHPNYKPPSQYNDIALLQLDKDVTFTEYVRPMCLYTQYALPPGKGIASGWGRQNWLDTDGSKTLMKVGLPFQKTEKCNEAFKPLTGGIKLRNGIDDASMICAGELDGNKDTCQGDSGGPLQIKDSNPDHCMYFIVGITSFGKTVCGAKDSPAIYTRVSHYLSWIETTVWS